MRKISIILTVISIMANAIVVNAVHRESAPGNATEEKIIITENFIGSVLDEVQSGLGYADARAKSNVIIFNT